MKVLREKTSSAFEDLLEKGGQAVMAADLDRALDLFQQAIEEAERRNRQELIERAVCNHRSVLVALGWAEEVVRELRRILDHGRRAATSYLAASILSRVYAMTERRKQALLYTTLSRWHAAALGDDVLIAETHY